MGWQGKFWNAMVILFCREIQSGLGIREKFLEKLMSLLEAEEEIDKRKDQSRQCGWKCRGLRAA